MKIDAHFSTFDISSPQNIVNALKLNSNLVYPTKINHKTLPKNKAVSLANIGVFGLPINSITEKLKPIPNVNFKILHNNFETLITIRATANNKLESAKLLKFTLLKLKKTFKSHVFGINVKNIQSALIKAATLKKIKIAVAESCTGGLVASKIVSVSGASRIFNCGLICYSNSAKLKFLHINEETLSKFGAVSFQTAKEMAVNIKKLSQTQIGIATTGIAEPIIGHSTKPTGLVYIAISAESAVQVYKLNLNRFTNNNARNKIREISSKFALFKALKIIEKLPQN